MVRLRLKLQGDGSIELPYHPRVPTFGMTEVNYEDGWCVVDLPEADVPGEEFREVEWHQHLDSRYREHAGEFRPLRA